jgi:hypothetical protein
MSTVEFERIDGARKKPWTWQCTCGCGTKGGRFKTLAGAKANARASERRGAATRRSTMPSCGAS